MILVFSHDDCGASETLSESFKLLARTTISGQMIRKTTNSLFLLQQVTGEYDTILAFHDISIVCRFRGAWVFLSPPPPPWMGGSSSLDIEVKRKFLTDYSR